MDREVAPESMKFGRAFPRIIQAICEADPNKGPIRVSKMDVTDTYHGGTLPPYHVVAFAYVIPLAADGHCIIICINMVLTMVRVDLPKFFCTFLEH